MGFLDWFRSAPPSRVERRIEFLQEQDGENERLLKAELLPVLESTGHIQRAYLVRAGFQPGDPTSVTLCLISTGGDEMTTVTRVAEVFKRFAPPNVFLDVAFPTASQEEDVARVCEPFYRRTS